MDYKWKGGKGVEIVSSEMAQFDLLRVVTENEASTNSKGRLQWIKDSARVNASFLPFFLH